MNIKKIPMLIMLLLMLFCIPLTTEAVYKISDYDNYSINIGKCDWYYMAINPDQEYIYFTDAAHKNVMLDSVIVIELNDNGRKVYTKNFGDVYSNASWVVLHVQYKLGSQGNTFQRLNIQILDADKNLISEQSDEKPFKLNKGSEAEWWANSILAHIDGRLNGGAHTDKDGHVVD